VGDTGRDRSLIAPIFAERPIGQPSSAVLVGRIRVCGNAASYTAADRTATATATTERRWQRKLWTEINAGVAVSSEGKHKVEHERVGPSDLFWCGLPRGVYNYDVVITLCRGSAESIVDHAKGILEVAILAVYSIHRSGRAPELRNNGALGMGCSGSFKIVPFNGRDPRKRRSPARVEPRVIPQVCRSV
jgi:hypothetical protein